MGVDWYTIVFAVGDLKKKETATAVNLSKAASKNDLNDKWYVNEGQKYCSCNTFDLD